MSAIGLIIKHTGSFYTVEEDKTSAVYNCTIRGRMRLEDLKTTNPIAVGDKVAFDIESENEGQITEVLPRKNYIIRRSTNLSRQAHILAANLDRTFLVITLVSPRTNWEFIDRFLVTAEAYKIPVTIVINKCDLYTTPELKDELLYFKAVYTNAGYNLIETSVINDTGIGNIRAILDNNISLFAGNSGVGKSSLLNAIGTNLELRIGDLSKAHNKGMHTTTFYEMFKLDKGYIIDSPGIKGFGLVDIEKEEVHHFFPEIFKISKKCRFTMCTHTHEPDCAVKEAIENNEIFECRYQSYLKILEGEDNKYR